MVSRLADSIESQRLIIQCEAGELQLKPQRIDLERLQQGLKAWFDVLGKARGCDLVVMYEETGRVPVTYLQRLTRVLGNLIRNAFEASEKGLSVTLTIHTDNERTSFAVHNVSVMPALTAAQIFKHRFTTNGAGHGLGIYSVQVLGEQYLGGQVELESTVETGTEFRFTLPNQPRRASP